jgi:alpha-tubulin suppressor-like RCC1 family protein
MHETGPLRCLGNASKRLLNRVRAGLNVVDRAAARELPRRGHNQRVRRMACCGSYHTACVTHDGALFTWGCAEHGQVREFLDQCGMLNSLHLLLG